MNEITIIGAGPAGIAASIYLKRAGIEPLLLEKKEIGGLLLNANLVENYPGFPDGISGKDLVKLFKEQLGNLNVEVKKEEVKKLSNNDDLFKLVTARGELISKTAIIATGTYPKKIDIKDQTNLLGKKLFYEIKDIPQQKGEDTFVIIGGGDAAFDYALNLSDCAKKVDIIFRGEKPKCLSLLEERVKERDNIHVHPITISKAVKDVKNQIKILCTSEEKDLFFESDYCLVACGRKPNLGILSEEIQNKLTIGDDGSTNIPGLYLAGDVRRGLFRQTGIAIGDGIICAMSAVNFLRGVENQ